MPIRVACPGCQASLKMADTLAGKSVKCPKCTSVVRVPGQGREGPQVDVLEEVNDEGVQELEEVEPERERPPRPRAAVEARDLDLEDDIPEHLRDRVLRNLRRGERLLWVGRPIAGLVLLRAVSFVAGFMVLAAFFAVVWAVKVLPLFDPARGQLGYQFGFLGTAFFVLFEVIILCRVLARIWEAIRGTLSCYLLTDRRAVVWAMPWHAGFQATNYLPADLTEMRRADSSLFGRRTGDLIFRTTRFVTVRRSRYGPIHSVTTTHYGFLAIPDAPDVERLVRETLVEPYEDNEDT